MVPQQSSTQTPQRPRYDDATRGNRPQSRRTDDPGPAFRSVAGRFATGVAVATTQLNGVPIGMTVNAFTTVSLDPTLLLICLNHQSRLLSAVRQSQRFAVTVLAADQRGCASWFAKRGRPTGEAAFADVRHHADPTTGCPLISDGVAYFGCVLNQAHPAGDHAVLIGEVQASGLLRPEPPLLFVDGGYAEMA